MHVDGVVSLYVEMCMYMHKHTHTSIHTHTYTPTVSRSIRFILQGPVLHPDPPSPSVSEIKEVASLSVEWREGRAGEGRAGLLLKLDLLLPLLLLLVALDMKPKRGIFQI